MRQFETQMYKGIAPFGTSLFHKQIEPKDESFLDMARFTLFPYFMLYNFSFFWILLISFVFFYSQSYEVPSNFIEGDKGSQFMKVAQAFLFQFGQNYPYHIVKNYHYYRVLTSMVLFRNFHHYLLVVVGILTVGSYIEKVMGFKRCFVLAILTGVVGILTNDLFYHNATLESSTPMSGILGFSFGYFLIQSGKEWKYYINEKINMMFLLIFLCLLYLQMMIMYSNINVLSNAIAMLFGFMFCFADPGEDRPFTIKNIVLILLMGGMISIVTLAFFFHTSPEIIVT